MKIKQFIELRFSYPCCKRQTVDRALFFVTPVVKDKQFMEKKDNILHKLSVIERCFSLQEI